MTVDKTCPGSRSIREPRPEFITCPDCGREVEIWTDELKATCPGCGNKVLKAQQASCIDWCPHAKDCVGPEVYERLRPEVEEAVSGADGALDMLKREHERVIDNIGLLRAASLCLKLGNLAPHSVVSEKGLDHLTKVLDFIDSDVRLHFRREEELLFPALEKHFDAEKSPLRLLLEEHAQMWQWYDQLREKLEILRKEGVKSSESLPDEVDDLGSRIEHQLREHIKKENESLLPLATDLLSEQELEKISTGWKSISLPAVNQLNV